MKTKTTFILVLLMILIISSFNPVFAQINDNQLLGIWKIDNDGQYHAGITYIGFYPGNQYYALFGEGNSEGHYVVTENQLILSGTFSYVHTNSFNHTFEFQLSGNRVTINSQDYYKVSGFRSKAPNCPGKLASQVQVGVFAHTTFTDGTSTRMRAFPDGNSEILTMLPEGTRFAITDGPVCGDTFTWWEIYHFNDMTTGWVAEGSDYYFIEPIVTLSDDPSPESPQVVLGETGATMYSPGNYPYQNNLQSRLNEFTAGAVDLSDLYVFSKQTHINGLDLVCALLDAQSINSLVSDGIIPEPTDSETVLCFVFDVTTWAIQGQPVAGSMFLLAEILANPEIYIDPWLDPVNEFFGSFPMTRTYCYLFEIDCDFLFGE